LTCGAWRLIRVEEMHIAVAISVAVPGSLSTSFKRLIWDIGFKIFRKTTQ
jgi:hypothetical protein